MNTPRLVIGPQIGAELRAARQRRGLGLREAAYRADIAQSYLHALEHGTRAPSGRVAAALAEVLALEAETTAALYGFAARVDAGRRERDAEREGAPKERRPRGWHEARRERLAELHADRQRDATVRLAIAQLRRLVRY